MLRIKAGITDHVVGLVLKDRDYESSISKINTFKWERI